jgi:apolipoprotein N-acyltransferase
MSTSISIGKRSASLVCWLSGVLVIEASDGWLAMLLVAMLVALPPVATLASFIAGSLAVFLAAVAGWLLVERVRWLEACWLREVAVLAGPWPLPKDVAASLGVGSKLTGSRLMPEPELDPAILGAGSEIDRYAGIR